jgi:NAD(P)-dependent dehydrogenase (short-subunit alcohol dehydrogenase family)
VLVTGANSGIGLAAVLDLARRGWQTWGSVRSEAKAEDVAEAAAEARVGERVRTVVLDVADHDAVVARWPEMPPFYAVVNNAGMSEMGAIEDVSAAEAKALLDVNLIAPAVVSACALPAMRERGTGRIVMISSMFGRAAVMPFNGWYHASKFGLEALSDVLRLEVAGFGVRVAIIEPGFFRTNIDARAAESTTGRAKGSSAYAAAYARLATVFDGGTRFAPPASVVAAVIASAIESPRPLRRYVVGADAMALVTASRLVPRAFLDVSARLMTGLRNTPERRS